MTIFGTPVAEIANIAIIITAFAALVTFALHYYQIKAQSKAVDLQSLLKVMGEINSAWEKLTHCEAKHWDFHFGQLLSSYELACYMANQKIIGPAAQEPLQHHIIEMIAVLVKEEMTLSKMKEIASSEHTYDEIIVFIKANQKAFNEQWNYIQDAGLVRTE